MCFRKQRKELDEETGLYYYGARYYNPRESVWLSTDPLSGYNPILEVEHYIDGQHNGGVFNSFNHNTYGYTYQNPIRYIDPNGKQVDVTLPNSPKDMDMAVWENYTPEKHKGHSQYWRHRTTGAFLVYDAERTVDGKVQSAHYHLYEDSKFGVRLDAEGIKSGTKVGNTKLSKGAGRFHIKGGAKLNMSAISKSLGRSLNSLGTFAGIIDIIKIIDNNPSAMFSSFNPNGNLNTAYGISEGALFDENIYYEIKSKKENGDINVNFYHNYYYDYDSERYRGRDKYDGGTLRKNDEGKYEIRYLDSQTI